MELLYQKLYNKMELLEHRAIPKVHKNSDLESESIINKYLLN